ncbi:PREDICTED: uncharacterized protein LOC108576158 [Habropoda laboriosa]|uniref:uncharacterized protein LOC108576158 n=1 Tax=Habropoda laboriosa TaxID=597456 RepID=UPI00083D2587|nr:PREDICTED: uncharacterized protein LOC108576158 [Habropoda laboriosa]
MDAITLEKRYLRINKKLGMLTGVWPYQKSSPKWISRTVVLFVIIPCYVTQYARIVTFPRIHIILNDYPYLITSLGVIIKFGNYFINESELKYLLGKIYEDWRAMTSEDEYKIMTKYAEKGIFSVILYILHISLCAALFMCLPFVSPILDILMPLNETRARLFVYPAYYFVDEDKYHYLIVGHMYLVVVMLISVFCACDANYVYAVQHACGLLAIAGNFVGFCLAENNCLLVDIVLNTPAMRYVKEITAAHDTCMFISVGLLMMSISTSLLQISEHEHDAEWTLYCTFFTAQLLHMLFLVVQGQFVLDAYDDVYNTITSLTDFAVTIMYAETVEERFMKLNKVLGLICGVWPRQNSRRKLITQILSLLLMASSIVTQIANTVLFFSMDNLVDGIPFNVAAVGTFVKLGNYIINETKLP